jgi:Domain of unknown function (DUF3846)
MTKKQKVHPHAHTDELAILKIAADETVPVEYKIIKNRWQSFKQVVGGYVTYVQGGMTPELPCGCPMAMIMDEEGLVKKLLRNDRASTFHPHLNGAQGIFGTVFLVGVGPVKNGSEEDVDFFSLPPNFHEWEGPGHPIPTNNSLTD